MARKKKIETQHDEAVKFVAYMERVVTALDKALEFQWGIRYISAPSGLFIEYNSAEKLPTSLISLDGTSSWELDVLEGCIRTEVERREAEEYREAIIKVALEKLTEEERKALGFK